MKEGWGGMERRDHLESYGAGNEVTADMIE